MRSKSPFTLAFAVATTAATLTLAGCVTGVDSETKKALQTTLESVQELTDLWQERLDALDPETGNGNTRKPTTGETPTGSAEIKDHLDQMIDASNTVKGLSL